MRKIKTSDITTGVGMPIKSGTLDQLQLAYQEALDALAKYNVGLSATDSTNYYVLYGCVVTEVDLISSITAGAIYYNGEIYLTDAKSVTRTGGNVVVGTITTTFNTTNADPVTFTDSSSKYVHEIRKIVWSSGASGSGNVNLSSLKYLTYQNRGNIGNTGMSFFTGTGTFGSTQYVDYKRYGDSIFLQFNLVITPATYTSGVVAIKIPLPINAYIPTSDTFYNNAALYQINSSFVLKSGFASISNSIGQYLYIAINDSVTTAMTIYGQIMYKAQ